MLSLEFHGPVFTQKCKKSAKVLHWILKMASDIHFCKFFNQSGGGADGSYTLMVPVIVGGPKTSGRKDSHLISGVSKKKKKTLDGALLALLYQYF